MTVSNPSDPAQEEGSILQERDRDADEEMGAGVFFEKVGGGKQDGPNSDHDESDLRTDGKTKTQTHTEGGTTNPESSLTYPTAGDGLVPPDFPSGHFPSGQQVEDGT